MAAHMDAPGLTGKKAEGHRVEPGPPAKAIHDPARRLCKEQTRRCGRKLVAKKGERRAREGTTSSMQNLSLTIRFGRSPNLPIASRSSSPRTARVNSLWWSVPMDTGNRVWRRIAL